MRQYFQPIRLLANHRRPWSEAFKKSILKPKIRDLWDNSAVLTVEVFFSLTGVIYSDITSSIFYGIFSDPTMDKTHQIQANFIYADGVVYLLKINKELAWAHLYLLIVLGFSLVQAVKNFVLSFVKCQSTVNCIFGFIGINFFS